jgi:undecaprenyl-diphosphatase
MNIFQAIILGITQGLTEFLPVSSSGHLVLLQSIFAIQDDVVLFDVFLHLATLFAVFIFFFKDVLNLFKPPFNTLFYLIIATIPAALAMLLFEDFIEDFFTGTYLCFGFLITAILLVITEITAKKSTIKYSDVDGINAKKSFVMGVAQAVAIIPGISRSGSTICAGVLSGADKKSVAEFSFFMSMPIIFGSAVVSMFKTEGASIDILPLLFGMAAAFFTALLAIKIMMKIIQKSNYKWFAVYLFAISALTFINTFVVRIW